MTELDVQHEHYLSNSFSKKETRRRNPKFAIPPENTKKYSKENVYKILINERYSITKNQTFGYTFWIYDDYGRLSYELEKGSTSFFKSQGEWTLI